MEWHNLGYNQLTTTLPEGIGGLSQLKELYLGNNKLTTLPEWIRGLSQLKGLDINCNKLKTLPEG